MSEDLVERKPCRKSFLSQHENTILEFLEEQKVVVEIDIGGLPVLPRGLLKKQGKPQYWSSNLRKCFERKLAANCRAAYGDLQRFLLLCDDGGKARVQEKVFGEKESPKT